MPNILPRKRLKQAWRPHLTDDEHQRLAELDKQLEFAAKLIAPFIEERQSIVKRARQRLDRSRDADRQRLTAA